MRCQIILKISLKLKAQRECLDFPSHLGRNVDDYNQATLSDSPELHQAPSSVLPAATTITAERV